MRLTFSGLEPWRITLILGGLALAFAGVLVLGSSATSVRARDIGMGASAVVGLVMVLAGLRGRQTSGSVGPVGDSLVLFQFVALPVLLYLSKLSTGWKIILAAWCVGCVAAAVLIARRRG